MKSWPPISVNLAIDCDDVSWLWFLHSHDFVQKFQHWIV